MERLPVSDSGPGWQEPGRFGQTRAARPQGSGEAQPLPPAHLDLASGVLRSQEVLTLHDSLNSGLGFRGKGDAARREVCWGLGWRGEPQPCSSGPEGGAGHDLQRPPPQGLGAHWVPTPVRQTESTLAAVEGLGQEGAPVSSWGERVGPGWRGQSWQGAS